MGIEVMVFEILENSSVVESIGMVTRRSRFVSASLKEDEKEEAQGLDVKALEMSIVRNTAKSFNVITNSHQNSQIYIYVNGTVLFPASILTTKQA